MLFDWWDFVQIISIGDNIFKRKKRQWSTALVCRAQCPWTWRQLYRGLVQKGGFGIHRVKLHRPPTPGIIAYIIKKFVWTSFTLSSRTHKENTNCMFWNPQKKKGVRYRETIALAQGLSFSGHKPSGEVASVDSQPGSTTRIYFQGWKVKQQLCPVTAN